jgi:hypothetical protein
MSASTESTTTTTTSNFVSIGMNPLTCFYADEPERAAAGWPIRYRSDDEVATIRAALMFRIRTLQVLEAALVEDALAFSTTSSTVLDLTGKELEQPLPTGPDDKNVNSRPATKLPDIAQAEQADVEPRLGVAASAETLISWVEPVSPKRPTPAEHIEQWVAKAGVSNEVLANRAHVAPSTIYRMKANQKCRPTSYHRVANVIKCSSDDLRPSPPTRPAFVLGKPSHP